MIARIDAAHWWGPVGWFYRALLSNVLASAVWGPIAFALGAAWEKRKVIHPLHRNADSLAELHEKHDRLHAHLGVPEQGGAE